jgi:uncharacterized protein (TIGR02145 family)
MKKNNLIMITVLMTLMILSSCGGSDTKKTNIESIPGEVTIGTQVWMTKNLNVDKFRNGDPIPEAKTIEEWKKAKENNQPAWCYYDNDPANGAKYGKLYNWYALNDARGLAPKGWHIPTDAEWTLLTDHLGGKDIAGTKMKSTSGWKYGVSNGNNNNSSGFSGLPGGYREFDGVFFGIDDYGYWWSSSVGSACEALLRNLDSNDGGVYSPFDSKDRGFSVRCLRD